ncbi:MAG: toluene tolerance protein [Cycloclasticus sp. symbiont of Poecilosclerida sp. M]|nr:MAG: toluene tolerance protein [Cycloclasticus sp. symbiont of Poecilosclerida sp. M]
MKKISKDAYLKLIEGGLIIEKEFGAIKVLEAPSGEIIKLFRRKRSFSSAVYYPYAKRFVDNAKKLTKLGIPTVVVKELLYCSAIKRHIVIYKKLEGEILRDALEKSTHKSIKIYQQFAEFLALLHGKGIYFRSIHLKNVLLLKTGELGLIDISDMKIRRQPLNTKSRIRNFSHMLPYQVDKDLFKKQKDSFITAYLLASGLTDKQNKQIIQDVNSLLLPPS